MTIPKKSPEERKRVLSFSLDPDVVDWLEEKTTRDSRSQFVNDVLSNHMGEDYPGFKSRLPRNPEIPIKKRGRPRKDKNDAIKRLEQELRK